MFSSFLLLLLCCFITHLQMLVNLKWGINLFDFSIVLVVNFLQGTAYLRYPLCGWVAISYLFDNTLFDNTRVYLCSVTYPMLLETT